MLNCRTQVVLPEVFGQGGVLDGAAVILQSSVVEDETCPDRFDGWLTDAFTFLKQFTGLPQK